MNMFAFLTLEIIGITIYMVVIDRRYKHGDDSSTPFGLFIIGVIYTLSHVAYLSVNS